MRKGSEISPQQ